MKDAYRNGDSTAGAHDAATESLDGTGKRANTLSESLISGKAARSAARRKRCSRLPWQVIFYMNVFGACISFSIVMPSLWGYLSLLGASRGFYAWAVAVYSIGEALGSVGLGALSHVLGTKNTLQLCTLISLVGGLQYGLAETCVGAYPPTVAPMAVFVSRLLQGIGSGGEQAVEQAYVGVAAPVEQRTELTGKISTFACLGFIAGPVIGAATAQLPVFSLGPVNFNVFTMPGFVVALLNALKIVNTLFFEEISHRKKTSRQRGLTDEDGDSNPYRKFFPAEDTEAPTGHSIKTNGEVYASRAGAEAAAALAMSARGKVCEGVPASTKGEREEQGAVLGIWSCIVFFFVHFNGFAVQETITTPLVQDWFEWGEVSANLLFVFAGVTNLVCAMLLSYLSAPRDYNARASEAASRFSGDSEADVVFREPRVGDRQLLFVSFVVASAGWLAMIPIGEPKVPQFFVAFTLVTVAFPFGRGLCLAMISKLLGDEPQGGWMGIVFAVGAIARVAGPFWAVHGYYTLGSFAVFGSTGLLCLLSLFALFGLWRRLDPAHETDARDFLRSRQYSTSMSPSHLSPRL
mmetsp:Transcript_28420/g.59739  ORF Transcript_28420/g.59739 Transcript_28420/m.59739 type:complete len:577 (+) Transcript_28420:181-1911(+)